MAKTAKQPQTKAAKRLTADEQIIEMKRLLPKSCAWLLGVRSARTLNENIHLGGLKQPDGTYDAQAILQYASTTRRRRTDRPGDRARMQSEQGGNEPTGDGTVLDYKRKLEAKKLELQLLEAEKKVVSVDMVRDFLLLVASRLRELGTGLQSQFGRDALEMLNETLSELEATTRRWEDGLKESEFEL